MAIYSRDFAKELEKACNISKKTATQEIDSYTEHRLIGEAFIGSDATAEYWEAVQSWEAHINSIWNSTSRELRVGEQIKKIIEGIYDIDENIFIDNDIIPEKLRAAAIFATVNYVNSLFIADYMDDELNIHEPNDTLLELSRKKTTVMMVIVLIMGSTDDARKIFYLAMETPLSILGKKTTTTQILTKDYSERFTDDFRDTLGTLSRTGNFILDVVYNDSTRDFILSL